MYNFDILSIMDRTALCKVICAKLVLLAKCRVGVRNLFEILCLRDFLVKVGLKCFDHQRHNVRYTV